MTNWWHNKANRKVCVPPICGEEKYHEGLKARLVFFVA
jgi:hypothetical protein